ncbi:MAG: helix-turn-helix transcriptional regulator [Calditrichaeota bacterium]|nr:helix-turn-helix transcriptional regulator [Calditrichota bacterium]
MADYPKVYLYRRIVQAKLFIDAHYQQEIRLDQICDQAYFSKFYFIRLFKQIYRLTPNQYLQERRINRAKNLLKAGESVSQVCVAVGFNSISTFTGLFKRSIGQTPSQFKQQQEQLRLSALQTPLKFIPHCFASSHAEKSNFEEVASSTAI